MDKFGDCWWLRVTYALRQGKLQSQEEGKTVSQSKRLFALLFSVMLTFALVPATALAEAMSGRIGEETGKITISNAKANETYDIWQMFKLISFRDSDPSTGAHPTAEEVSSEVYETYSYAIVPSDNEDSWYYFLTHYGPDTKDFNGVQSNTPYAVLTTETSANKMNAAYFIINAQASTIELPDTTTLTYHVIKANRAVTFMNDWDSPDSMSSRNDEGVSASEGINYSDTAATNGSKTNLNYNAVQDFAQAAVAYAKANGIAPTATRTAPSENPSIEFAGVELGYYLMGTSMGALASLDTTNKDVNIYEKNDEPTIEKSVLKKGEEVGLVTPAYLTGANGDGAVWVTNTDADINDLVQFRTVITAQQGADSYVLHDVMEDGFEFVSTDAAPQNTNINSYTGVPTSGYTYSPKVYLVKETTVYAVPNTALVPISGGNSQTANNWAIVSGTGVTNAHGCDFEIRFSDGDANVTDRNPERAVVFGATKIYENEAAVSNAEPAWVEITDGDKIVVTYWARVTPAAAVLDNEKAAATANTATVPVNTSSGTAVSIANQPDGKNNGSGRNDNHTILTYGGKSYTAAFKTASVTTYGFDITKTLEGGLNGAATQADYVLLDGAEFSVYKVVEQGPGTTAFQPQGSGATVYYNTNNKLRFVEGQTDDEQQALLGTDYTNTHTFYRYAGDVANTTGTTTTVVSKDGKAMHLYGLESGAYVLVEDKAPSGYNKLAHPVVVTIIGPHASQSDGTEGNILTHFRPNDGTDGSTTYNRSDAPWKSTITAGTNPNSNIYTETDNGGAHIVNQTGKELPSTGGMGTTVFYVVGGVLVIGAVVLFVTKRRVGTSV